MTENGAVSTASLRRETALASLKVFIVTQKNTSFRLSNRAVLLNVGATPTVILGLIVLMDVADLQMAKDQKIAIVVRY